VAIALGSYTRGSPYTLSGLTRTVGYDADSRITAFTHNQSTYDQTFSYDNLDRLSGWSGFNITQGFGYDLTGNRTNLSIGGSSYPYTVQSSSNRVTQTAGPGGNKSFGFDATGNTTSAGSLTFAYDARGRMISATTALGPVIYQLNALGQRVAKTVSGTTTRYHYDANGNLIGETTGSAHRDYAWLGHLPVAILEGTSQYYIHADHLDTPRVVTNAANMIVWRWDSDPFGFFPAAEDPDGNSQLFILNLRFPGQYFDKETGLHYNTFRDYDPQTGRYVESDPIGLGAGLNTYAYVRGDPMARSDPFGLRDRCPTGRKAAPLPGGEDQFPVVAACVPDDSESPERRVCMTAECAYGIPRSQPSCCNWDAIADCMNEEAMTGGPGCVACVVTGGRVCDACKASAAKAALCFTVFCSPTECKTCGKD